MKCPYCNKSNCIPNVVYFNIEAYGSSFVRFRCLHCKKVIKGYGERKVFIGGLTKTDEESDWG